MFLSYPGQMTEMSQREEKPRIQRDFHTSQISNAAETNNRMADHSRRAHQQKPAASLYFLRLTCIKSERMSLLRSSA